MYAKQMYDSNSVYRQGTDIGHTTIDTKTENCHDDKAQPRTAEDSQGQPRMVQNILGYLHK